jgi:molecular chaperone HtpG
MAESSDASPLSRLPAQQRDMYEHFFGLIYECSTNRSAAKALIDRILLKIT